MTRASPQSSVEYRNAYAVRYTMLVHYGIMKRTLLYTIYALCDVLIYELSKSLSFVECV